MCFLLYAGTDKPLARNAWNMNDPHVYVRDLDQSESWARRIFSKPEIQYIGSTTSCGCGFPSVMQDSAGGWSYWLDPVSDAEEIVSDRQECEELFQLLSQLDENDIELYGLWAGDGGKEPRIREEIRLDDILQEYFRFKHGGFYRVVMR